MRYPKLFIIYACIQNYLTVEKAHELKDELSRHRGVGPTRLKKILPKYLDIELLRSKPFIWQDIWIYNYLMYEAKEKMIPSKLITRYGKEIITPQRKIFAEAMSVFE
jgi:hypothetical protein